MKEMAYKGNFLWIRVLLKGNLNTLFIKANNAADLYSC